MKLHIECRGESFDLQPPAGRRLLDELQANDIPVNAACGGAGSCQKCRVQISDGFVGISTADRKAFSEQELKAGWRLSCQATLRTNVKCRVPDVENLRAAPRIVRHAGVSQDAPILACDLGSTGVVVALGNGRGENILEAHLLNRQVRLGADVMTRLKVAQDRGVDVLHDKVIETLELCLNALRSEEPALFEAARAGGLYCAGNSALVSFLHGWDTAPLATYPFQPLHRDARTTESARLGLRLHSLPLLGGFVGADAFAGALWLNKGATSDLPWMMVDIGTNTEIVLSHGDALWFASAPAGPAFEGGNIASGMRAEPGAISHARFRNGAWDLETIGGDRPRGICGSGLVEAIFEAVQGGLITVDGFVAGGRVHLTDTVSLLADDIREFQLAKAATRTACDLLIQRAGVTPNTIYLAGAFAEHLREDALQGTGLLPPGIGFKFVGNASLAGTLLYASASESQRVAWTQGFEARRRPLELALQDDFQDAFVKNLNF